MIRYNFIEGKKYILLIEGRTVEKIYRFIKVTPQSLKNLVV